MIGLTCQIVPVTVSSRARQCRPTSRSRQLVDAGPAAYRLIMGMIISYCATGSNPVVPTVITAGQMAYLR